MRTPGKTSLVAVTSAPARTAKASSAKINGRPDKNFMRAACIIPPPFSTHQILLFVRARLVQHLDARSRAEIGVGPLPQRPDHLFVRRHLDDLDGFRPVRLLF